MHIDDERRYSINASIAAAQRTGAPLTEFANTPGLAQVEQDAIRDHANALEDLAARGLMDAPVARNVLETHMQLVFSASSQVEAQRNQGTIFGQSTPSRKS